MRCDRILGYYVQYKDSGRPVEVLDRVTYAFQGEDRTCLIQNPTHLALLLKTDRYRVVGVELEDPAVPESDVEDEETPPKKRARAKKES